MKDRKSLAPWSRCNWRVSCTVAAALSSLFLAGCGGSSDSADDAVLTIIEANISTLAAQIGGATQDVELYNDGTTDWTLFTMANRFGATPVGMEKGTVTELTVPGYIQHITVIKAYAGKSYALLSMGNKGIGVVDITNPAAMTYVRTMTVDYLTPAYTYSDGGGTIFTEPAAIEPLLSGPVNDMLVYDDQPTPTEISDDDQLLIANGAFGIQKTKLSNLMGATADGPVAIDGAQTWTLKYASENPMGDPLSLKMHGGKLYAALGFVGIGIYNPKDLTRTSTYNLYADCTNAAQEDWFGYPKRKIACPNVSLAAGVVAGGVDADGMPSYLQAAEELGNKNDRVWYPWAEFDRYGKYYYKARNIDLVDLPGGKTMAYIAYSLGGLVAVDVTNASETVKPTYVGYVPAAPAHGPDEPPINVDKKGILSHFGSGMLKEAGVMDVRVVPDPDDSAKLRAYYTDHFAGLVVVSGAEAPGSQWKNGGSGYNNDSNARVFWPDYEFVTSYDMTPVPVGDESMPKFLTADTSGNYTAPVMLVTGEINGHGGSLIMLNGDTKAAGQVDLVESSGGGGVSFVDIIDLTGANVAVASRFAVPVSLVSTSEVGAAEDGSPTQPIAIGHAEGVTVSGNFLYLADGPHGVTAWRIADGLSPIDDLHLVANTYQDEYPTPGSTVLPTPHAFKVAFGDDPTKAYVMSQSLGMRRIDVSAVTSGSAAVGAPALLNANGGIFEHNTDDGSNVSTVKVTGQDHAYGVAFAGKYAIVADGDNGLTVYDTTVDPATGAHVVANIGDSEGTTGKPPLGRAATVKLWADVAKQKAYAVIASGAYGVSVVDMTAFFTSGLPQDLGVDKLIKTFEPVKSDADNAFGSADGKSVDVHIVNDIAYFSYDSFGLVAYRMTDLIRPATEERPAINPTPEICATITDVTKLSAKQGGVGECRPTAVGYFKLQKYGEVVDATGVVVTPSIYADVDGGALYMTAQAFPTVYRDATGQVVTADKPRLLFYVGYGAAGVVKLDWSDVANPQLMAIKGVVGGASGTAINNGRVYVAAGTGGLAVLK